MSTLIRFFCARGPITAGAKKFNAVLTADALAVCVKEMRKQVAGKRLAQQPRKLPFEVKPEHEAMHSHCAGTTSCSVLGTRLEVVRYVLAESP